MELTPFLPSFLIHPSIVTVCHLHRVPPSACPLPSLTPSLPHSLPPPFFYPIRVTTSLLPKCNPNSYRRLVPSTSHSHIQGWMSGWHMHRGAAGSLPSGNCRWSSLSLTPHIVLLLFLPACQPSFRNRPLVVSAVFLRLHLVLRRVLHPIGNACLHALPLLPRGPRGGEATILLIGSGAQPA